MSSPARHFGATPGPVQGSVLAAIPAKIPLENANYVIFPTRALSHPEPHWNESFRW
jgi:hypothetical protein